MPESPPRRRLLTWTALGAILSLAAPAVAAPHVPGSVHRGGAAATRGDGGGIRRRASGPRASGCRIRCSWWW